MSNYWDLSAYQRDVLAAVATLEPPAASKTIKHRVAEIRGESPTPYAYQILDLLVDDGWLTRRTDETDKRVALFRLTEKATAALTHHFDLLADLIAKIEGHKSAPTGCRSQ